MKNNYSVFRDRFEKLKSLIAAKYPESPNGIILLLGNFEHETIKFKQESSFYYLTGIEEPGSVLTSPISSDGILFVPRYQEPRSKWMSGCIEPSDKQAQEIFVQNIEYLGDACRGYNIYPNFSQNEYRNLIEFLKVVVSKKVAIFTLCPDKPGAYVNQRIQLERLARFVPELTERLVDISPLVAQLRRKKDKQEIELIYKAINCTMDAHETALTILAPGINESKLQAAIEYAYASESCRAAFPSIVAGGKNSTILHYHDNNTELKSGDLVVVDIGAEHDYYCADLTRTYPVSGKFTERQKEIYNLVLETQLYIQDLAVPGYWLNNKDFPEKSLNHLAKKFLDDAGYGKYFTHSIGHFLGIDVHDVGDYSKPIEEGDVITIEPGIYIPEENLGVRIEDDYWIVDGEAICLSEELPKDIDDIEKFMALEKEQGN